MLVAKEAGMWNLLKRTRDSCHQLRDLLEDSAVTRFQPMDVEELLEALPPAQRTHVAGCRSCREAAEELLAVQKIFYGVRSHRE
jgi:Mg/Co/Ni transporter MgtE